MREGGRAGGREGGVQGTNMQLAFSTHLVQVIENAFVAKGRKRHTRHAARLLIRPPGRNAAAGLASVRGPQAGAFRYNPPGVGMAPNTRVCHALSVYLLPQLSLLRSKRFLKRY